MRLIWIIFSLVLFSVIGVSESFAQDLEIIPSLKHQLESGVAPEEITCRDNRILVLRTNGNFACVKETTSEKLGWTIIERDSNIIEDKSNQDLKLKDSLNVIDANNQFAFDFYSKISQESDDNVFFSPWSISTAFAIVFEGAKGDTADEIRHVFGFPENQQQRQTEFKSINDDLNRKDASYDLTVANALWPHTGIKPFEQYVDTAKTYYDTKVTSVNLSSQDGIDIINKWVEAKTNNKIKDLIPGPISDPVLAITNAIYFKGTWITQFDEDNTHDQNFWLNDADNVKVPMMNLDVTSFNYTDTDNLQIIELPYEGNKISMLIILPNDKNGISSLDGSLTLEKLNAWRDDLNPTDVIVQIPKFKLDASYNLIPFMKSLGMEKPFGDADFSGIANIPMFIQGAYHKAFVDVNEEGTEAAAATAIVMATEAAGPSYPMFIADHPFIFIIQDTETDNILFMGKMMNPEK
jgi:serpin B